MTEAVAFYTNPMSRGRIARWMLEETGVPYETHIVDYGPTMKAEAYRAINPMGKVPAIVHRGVAVTECAAICAYLADAFPAAGLAPAPGDPARGAYFRWLFFAAGPVEAAVTARALDQLPPAEKSGMVGYGSFDLMVDTLEGAVRDGPWLLGDRFSAADVYVGAQVAWGLQFNSLPDRPAFKAYTERLTAREAYQRAKAEDDRLVMEAKAAKGG